VQLVADPPQQQSLQLAHVAAGDEVPEQAAEAVAAVPAVLLREAVVALVEPDQAILVVDRVAEGLNGHWMTPIIGSVTVRLNARA